MTLTPEWKQAVEKAGDEPVRVEDPETHTADLIVREDVYRRMNALTVVGVSDTRAPERKAPMLGAPVLRP